MAKDSSEILGRVSNLEQDDSSDVRDIETEVFQTYKTNTLVIAFVFMLAMDLHAARRT